VCVHNLLESLKKPINQPLNAQPYFGGLAGIGRRRVAAAKACLSH